jgi:hypothetical protein
MGRYLSVNRVNLLEELVERLQAFKTWKDLLAEFPGDR